MLKKDLFIFGCSLGLTQGPMRSTLKYAGPFTHYISQGSHKIPGLPDSTSQGLANKLMPPHLAKNFTLTSTVKIQRPFVLSRDMRWELILPSLKSTCWLAVEIGFC